MKINLEGWTGDSTHERFWLWQIPGIRPLFILWYKAGGFYLSGWTPFVVRNKRG